MIDTSPVCSSAHRPLPSVHTHMNRQILSECLLVWAFSACPAETRLLLLLSVLKMAGQQWSNDPSWLCFLCRILKITTLPFMPYSKLAREHMWIYLLLMCFNSGSPKATTEKISIFDMCYFQIPKIWETEGKTYSETNENTWSQKSLILTSESLLR